jgi:hypothetical protein
MPPGFRPQNLNDVFQAAANQVRQKPEQLSHNQMVGFAILRTQSVVVKFFNSSLIRSAPFCFSHPGVSLVPTFSSYFTLLGRRS